jgi:hypothetical protein
MQAEFHAGLANKEADIDVEMREIESASAVSSVFGLGSMQ